MRAVAFWVGMAMFGFVQASGAAEPLAPPEKPAEIADWPSCIARLQQEAIQRGHGEDLVQSAFRDMRPDLYVISLDRRQPEFQQTFWQYLDRRLTPDRIERGRKLLNQHGAMFDAIAERYGVDPEYMVAFWGLESNFGDFTGKMNVLRSLTTLACDARRSAFFSGEVMNALAILSEGAIAPDRMLGSWAGAMGQTQFMPSTFLAHAVDGDGDGRRDLWGSLEDVFHSSANYLSKIGWRRNAGWGQEVSLPQGFDLAQADAGTRQSLDFWGGQGVTGIDGAPLAGSGEAAIILPAGHKGPALAIYGNFDVIMNWNRSTSYALSVGMLADRLAGRAGLVSQAPTEAPTPLRTKEIIEIQERLIALGFDTGKPDGLTGPMTRGAIRAFQTSRELPADGFADQSLLELLRQLSPNVKVTNS